jgi:hypothetical protein
LNFLYIESVGLGDDESEHESDIADGAPQLLEEAQQPLEVPQADGCLQSHH